VPEPLHHLERRGLHQPGQFRRQCGRGGEIVFAGQQVQRALLRIEPVEQSVPEIAVGEIVMQVAQEDARTALHVMPQHLPLLGVGRRRRDQAGDRTRGRFLAMHVGPEQHAEITQPRIGARIGMGRRLQADGGPEVTAVLQRQMQHRASADRAAHHHRAVEPQRAAERHHRVDIEFRGQAIGFALETARRRGLAVPRQVEDDDAEAAGDPGIIEKRAILSPVGAGSMQADQGDSLARFLEIYPVRLTVEVHP